MTKSTIDGGFGDQTLKTERLGVCQALSFRRERSKRWRCPGWPFPWSPGPAQGQGLVGWHWLRGQGDRAGRWSTEGRRVAPAWVPGRCIHHLRSLCHISLVSALVPLGRGVLGRVRRLTWSPAGRWGGPQGLTASSSPIGRVVQGLAPPNELVHFRVEALQALVLTWMTTCPAPPPPHEVPPCPWRWLSCLPRVACGVSCSSYQAPGNKASHRSQSSGEGRREEGPENIGGVYWRRKDKSSRLCWRSRSQAAVGRTQSLSLVFGSGGRRGRGKRTQSLHCKCHFCVCPSPGRGPLQGPAQKTIKRRPHQPSREALGLPAPLPFTWL